MKILRQKMAQKQWYLCISENVLGPVDTKTMRLILQQGRLQFHEFVWHPGLTQWTPIYQIDEFVELAPPYPKAPLPMGEKSAPPAPTKSKIEKKSSAAPMPLSAPKAPLIRTNNRIQPAGTVKVDGGGEYAILDLGQTGVFFACSEELSIGSEYKFQLSLTGMSKPFEMTGLAVRQGVVREKAGYAFEFTRINPAHARALTEFIETFRLKQAG